MDPHAIAKADEFTAEANEKIATLITDAAEAAEALTDYCAGAGLDMTRLAMHGSPEQLDLWRDTRRPDAELQMLVAGWREQWRRAVNGARRLGNLAPRGLDVYGWEAPEECDHEQVRLGADVVQYDGLRQTTLVHVDVVRVAQQPTPFRLLGPTEAEELLGVDGILQDGHPLRSGTSHGSPHYGANEPTWTPPKPEPHTPAHYPWDPVKHARMINKMRYDREAQETGGVR